MSAIPQVPQQNFAHKAYVLLEPFSVFHFLRGGLLDVGELLLYVFEYIRNGIWRHGAVPADVAFAGLDIQFNGSYPCAILAAVMLFFH